MTDRPTAIDIFSGAGGMSLGFEQAGFDVLAAVDHDPIHLATHAFNFPRTETLCRDVEGLTGDEVLDAARRGWEAFHGRRRWPGKLDCVFGGPSCQGFSVIGRRDPGDRRNRLLLEFARLVAELKPRFFVLENVPGLISPAYVSIVSELLARFHEAGYVVDHGSQVLDAADYGVPQERRRVFIVGRRRGERQLVPPRPWSTRRTVDDALADLPDLDSFPELLDDDAVKVPADVAAAFAAGASDYALYLRGERDPEDLAYPRASDPARLTSSRRTIHQPSVKARFATLDHGTVDETSRLPRLAPDSQSPTLRAGTGRDHGSFTSARPVHHRRPRVISVREAARLHSFPDWFRFHSTKWHGFRQVGNSVPPLLARGVAKTVADAIGRRPSVPATRWELGDGDLLRMSLQEAAVHFDMPISKLPRDSRRLKPRDTSAAAAA